MDSCGQRFTQEVCKFRFLNEMIRLVSKQHDGNKTPKEIQTKILDIMFTWITKYPNESKIKEAYDMLKTQGIIHEPTKNVMITNNSAAANLRPDRNAPLDPRHLMLKKLINSKNKDDIQKANLLIQNMCREDERKFQIKGRRLAELRKASESVALLHEMLDNYNSKAPCADDLQIINELNDTCELFQPSLLKLISETEEKDEALGEIIEVNDQLVTVLDKYRRKVVLSEDVPATSASENSDLLQDILGLEKPPVTIASGAPSTNVMDVLGDIFSKSEPTTTGTPTTSTIDLLVPQKADNNPVPVSSNLTSKSLLTTLVGPSSKYDVLHNLSKLQNTSSATITPAKPQLAPPKKFGLDLDSLVDGMKTKLLPQSSQEEINGDDDEAILDSSDPKPPSTEIVKNTFEKDANDDLAIITMINKETYDKSILDAGGNATVQSKPSFKSLAEIHIDLDCIQPSNEPPRVILDEDKGLKIMLNFAKDRPRDDVLVAVISTINYGSQAVKNFQFEASISKPCKLRLLPASTTELPAAKPFRPPADSIFQILLVANPTQQTISKITCIFSYCLADDPDPLKESVEVNNLPYQVE